MSMYALAASRFQLRWFAAAVLCATLQLTRCVANFAVAPPSDADSSSVEVSALIISSSSEKFRESLRGAGTRTWEVSHSDDLPHSSANIATEEETLPGSGRSAAIPARVS